MTRDDFAAVYRHRLQSTSQPEPGLVGGLAETGGESDIPALHALIDSPRSRIRYEALKGIARIDRDVASDSLIQHLSDTSGRVRRLVTTTLAADLSDNELSQLHAALTNDENETTGITAMRTLWMLGSWGAVPALLLGASSKFEVLRDEAWDRGSIWMKKHASIGWLKPAAKVRPYLGVGLVRYQERAAAPPDEYTKLWEDLISWSLQVSDAE